VISQLCRGFVPLVGLKFETPAHAGLSVFRLCRRPTSGLHRLPHPSTVLAR
jgi:hypothetical protein